MSACRFVSKCLFRFFNEASDDKPEELVAIPSIHDAFEEIEQRKSMLDFVRDYAGNVIARVRSDNAESREVVRLNSLLESEKNPEIYDNIKKEKEKFDRRPRWYMSFKAIASVSLLLGVETDSRVRNELIEWIENKRKDKHGNSFYIALCFLSKSEITEGMSKSLLSYSGSFVSGTVLRFNTLDDENKRMGLINELLRARDPNLAHIIPFLAEVIDRLSLAEAERFLPFLSSTLRLHRKEHEYLRRYASNIIEQMRDLNYVTVDEFCGHGIRLEPVNKIDVRIEIVKWEELLKNEIKSTNSEPRKFSRSEINLLARVVCHKGNDEVLLLLMEYLVKGKTSKELLNYFSKEHDFFEGKPTGFSLYSQSMSFALSRVFKKGYSFASLETKKKMHQFLLDQFVYLYQKAGVSKAEYILKDTEIVGLLKFVMTEMQSESERVQFLNDLITKREAAIGESECFPNVTIELITHCICLYKNQPRLQAIGSALEDERINFPEGVPEIVKGYALSL